MIFDLPLGFVSVGAVSSIKLFSDERGKPLEYGIIEFENAENIFDYHTCVTLFHIATFRD